MLVKTKWAFDLHLARKSKPQLSHKPEASYKSEWWSWCDALYMAPPSLYHFANITGEEKYRQYAFDHWKLSTEFLYSEKDSLFYRDDRYFDAVSENGFSVFWSRGNGWVIGGLARILTYLPANHPQREYYTGLFREMAAKILSLQQPDGLWTVSLLDPEYLPKGEASGSGFFGYALAWGVNNGLLEPAIYEPAVRMAWASLSSYVNDAGRLGNVQQIAGDPFPFYEHQWHVYASGAYLLFGREILELVNTTK
jgi:rhamnogalacturonyl hydrolase YesR